MLVLIICKITIELFLYKYHNKSIWLFQEENKKTINTNNEQLGRPWLEIKQLVFRFFSLHLWPWRQSWQCLKNWQLYLQSSFPLPNVIEILLIYINYTSESEAWAWMNYLTGRDSSIRSGWGVKCHLTLLGATPPRFSGSTFHINHEAHTLKQTRTYDVTPLVRTYKKPLMLYHQFQSQNEYHIT